MIALSVAGPVILILTYVIIVLLAVIGGFVWGGSKFSWKGFFSSLLIYMVIFIAGCVIVWAVTN